MQLSTTSLWRLICAFDVDSFEIKEFKLHLKYLLQSIIPMSTIFLENRVIPRGIQNIIQSHDSELSLLAAVLYYSAILLKDNRTLGHCFASLILGSEVCYPGSAYEANVKIQKLQLIKLLQLSVTYSIVHYLSIPSVLQDILSNFHVAVEELLNFEEDNTSKFDNNNLLQSLKAIIDAICKTWNLISINAEDRSKKLLDYLKNIYLILFLKNKKFYEIALQFCGIRVFNIGIKTPYLRREIEVKILRWVLIFYVSIVGIDTIRNVYSNYQYLAKQETILENRNPTMKDNTENSLCPLCRDSINDTSSLPCGHMFCWHCVMTLKQSRNSLKSKCPICRQPFSFAQVRPVYDTY